MRQLVTVKFYQQLYYLLFHNQETEIWLDKCHTNIDESSQEYIYFMISKCETLLVAGQVRECQINQLNILISHVLLYIFLSFSINIDNTYLQINAGNAILETIKDERSAIFKDRTKDSMLFEGHISCLQARYEVRTAPRRSRCAFINNGQELQ